MGKNTTEPVVHGDGSPSEAARYLQAAAKVVQSVPDRVFADDSVRRAARALVRMLLLRLYGAWSPDE